MFYFYSYAILFFYGLRPGTLRVRPRGLIRCLRHLTPAGASPADSCPSGPFGPSGRTGWSGAFGTYRSLCIVLSRPSGGFLFKHSWPGPCGPAASRGHLRCDGPSGLAIGLRPNNRRTYKPYCSKRARPDNWLLRSRSVRKPAPFGRTGLRPFRLVSRATGSRNRARTFRPCQAERVLTILP